MAGLALGRGVTARGEGSGIVENVSGEKIGFVAAAGALPVAPKGIGDLRDRLGQCCCQISEEKLGQPGKGELVRAPGFGVEPVGEFEKCLEGEGMGPEARDRLEKIAAVGVKVPITGETTEALHEGKIEEFVLQDFVGRMRAVNHLPFGIVPDNGGPAKAFEDADLNLLGAEGDEAVEAGAERGKRFAGKADDQISVHMDAGALTKKAEVVGQAGEVLAARDVFGGGIIEGLNADLELEGAGGKAGDDAAQSLGQAIGNHLEMDKKAGAPAIEKELENGGAGGEIEVEGAINKFELAGAAVEKFLQSLDQGGKRELADGNVERGEAEFAGERATARGFDIKDAMGEVFVGVEIIGKGELVGKRQGGGDDLFAGRTLIENLAADRGELKVGFARDDEIGMADDFLAIGFIADFGAAKNEGDVGPEAFEGGGDLDSLGGVPDVNAESDDAGILGENGFDHIEGTLLKIEFEDGGARAERAEIGEEITEAERRVNVFGVEGGQDDVGHGREV